MHLDIELKRSINFVLEYINDPLLFNTDYEEFQLKSDELLLKRLGRWQKFFNKRFMNAPCIYSSMNFALLNAAKSNDIFRHQTGHEFQLSIAFFERLINSGIFLKINDIESAQYLLNTSLIFSKFPGMVIRPFFDCFRLLTDGITIDKMYRLFESLFVKYESPRILVRHLNVLSHSEIEGLIHILAGNNLRTFNEIPFPISKKEAFILINKLPEHLRFKDNVLKRAIIASKLFVLQSDDENY